MILAELKRFLQQRGDASLQEIALHLKCEPDAARGMLELLQRKGRVEQHQLAGACGGSCCKCPPEVTERYAWRGDKDTSRRPRCPELTSGG